MDEVESLLKQVDVGASGPREQVKFIKTDNVRIIDGPFLGFNGVVDEVAQDHGRLKVLVSIFGRSTPVELGFLQVERIKPPKWSNARRSVGHGQGSIGTD